MMQRNTGDDRLMRIGSYIAVLIAVAVLGIAFVVE
jgi:hypothetical protein